MTVVASQFNTNVFNARPHTTGVSETDEGDTTDTPTDLTERFNYDEDCKKSALRTLRDATDGTTVATGAYLASRDHNVGVDDNETLLYEVVGVVPDDADVDEWAKHEDQRMSLSSAKLAQFIQQVTYWAYHDGYARGYGVEALTDANKRVIDSGWQEWHDRESIYTMDGAPELPVTDDEDTE